MHAHTYAYTYTISHAYIEWLHSQYLNMIIVLRADTYVYFCIYVYICIYIYMYLNMVLVLCAHIYVYMYICMYMYVCICICIYIYIYLIYLYVYQWLYEHSLTCLSCKKKVKHCACVDVRMKIVYPCAHIWISVWMCIRARIRWWSCILEVKVPDKIITIIYACM